MARRSASSGCRNSAQELDILQLIAACTGPYAPPESLKTGRQLEAGERTVRRHQTLFGMENRSSDHRTGGKIAWRRISPPTGTDPMSGGLEARAGRGFGARTQGECLTDSGGVSIHRGSRATSSVASVRRATRSTRRWTPCATGSATTPSSGVAAWGRRSCGKGPPKWSESHGHRATGHDLPGGSVIDQHSEERAVAETR